MPSRGSGTKRRKRLEALARRAYFLEQRIADYNADGNPSRDKAELGALRWVFRDLAPREDLLAMAERNGWVIGAKRWQVIGCTCVCTADGLGQWRDADCCYHGRKADAHDTQTFNLAGDPVQKP